MHEIKRTANFLSISNSSYDHLDFINIDKYIFDLERLEQDKFLEKCFKISNILIEAKKFKKFNIFVKNTHSSKFNIVKYALQNSNSVNCIAEEDLIQGNLKLALLSADAGAGKSELFNHLCFLNSQRYPFCFSKYINLHDYTEQLEKLKEDLKFEKELNTEYVLREFLGVRTALENCYFLISNLKIRKHLLLLDSFDEISPEYQEIVTKLTKYLQNNFSSINVYVSTRPWMFPYIQENFGEFQITLRPFSDKDKFKFLTQTMNNSITKNQISGLIQNLPKMFDDKDNTFVGNPQTMVMISKIIKEEPEFLNIKNLKKSDVINIKQVFEKFIKITLDSFFKKSKVHENNLHNKRMRLDTDRIRDVKSYCT
jgi:hypothetical protein